MTAQLSARLVSFHRGPQEILSGINLTVAPGQRLGVVGPNGVGKSTLLRVLAGQLPAESGQVTRHPANATVTLLDQELASEAGETARQYLARRVGAADAEANLADAAEALASGEAGADDRYGDALDAYLRSGAADLDVRLATVLDDLGLDADVVDRATTTLSGGQRGRVGLAAVLLSTSDVLLLDEPTNDLDLAGLAKLEAFVLSTSAALVVVSHDRHFLARVVTGVVELDEHERSARIFDGGWQAYLAERTNARRLAEERFDTYTGQRDALAERAQREREWATQGVKNAKTKATDGDKHSKRFRQASSEQVAARSARTERARERLDVVDKPWEGWQLKLSIASTGRSGDLVAELKQAVVQREGGFRLGPLDVTIHAGERVALVGPNGSGKSTMLAALLGDVALSEGSSRQGPSVVVGRLAQARDAFAADATLLSGFLEATGVELATARSTLAKFGLGAEHVGRPTVALSPGERTRAVLALFQTQGVNLLVLDEPTNHLDLPAIEQLEQAIDTFDGTVLLVTHDRAFLETVRLTRRLELQAGRLMADVPLGSG